MSSTLRYWLNAGSRLDIEGADAPWAIQVIRRQGEEIYVVLLNVDRDLACRSDGIHVEESTLLVDDLADLRYGFDGADFIVSIHDGNQNRVVCDCFAQGFDVNDSIGVHR